MVRAEKPEIKKTASLNLIEIQLQSTHEVERRQDIPESQVTSLSPREINNLAAWEMHAEERQANLQQTGLEGAVQLRVVSTPTESVQTGNEDKLVARRQPIKSIKSVGNIATPIELRVPLDFEPVPIDIEYSQAEAIIANDLENSIALEYFDPSRGVFEQSEQYFSSDEAYSAASLFEEHESVDALLADLEESIQLVEAEYIGELLVGMFEDFVERNDMDKQGVVVDVINSLEINVIQEFDEEFDSYLESLESIQIELTKNVIEALRVVVKEAQQLTEETTENKEVIGQRLEELCIQLFEGLGIEYNEETVTRFIQNIKTFEPIVGIDIPELSLEGLNSLGTREYKPPSNTSLLGRLTQFIKQKMQPHLMLGKYALRVSVT